MGKTTELKPIRKNTLENDIIDAQFVKPKVKRRRETVRLKCDIDEPFVEGKLSKRILKTARKQRREIEGTTIHSQQTTSLQSDDESDLPSETEDFGPFEPDGINEEDEAALERFMCKATAPRRTLADLIMGKISEKQTELNSIQDGTSVHIEAEIDPRVRQMFQGVGDVLRKYRSGKVPKAFKILPTLKNWEQILHITDPGSWTAAAMYQATRIFASNLKDKMAQRFYNLVLLPRVRDDITEYKRLNYHLYQALRKALYKPGGFMKGILLPLLEGGDCTLREAIIIGSVVAKNSLPILHSSAVMLKIAEMDYTGANSIFLRIFFEKRYALPYRVVDGVVFHFLRFSMDTRELPTLWHQALLTFVQRYKADISSEQRDALLDLLRKQRHPVITSEIRRELQNAKCRDLEDASNTKVDQMDFT